MSKNNTATEFSEVTEVTGVTSLSPKASGGNPAENPEVTEVTITPENPLTTPPKDPQEPEINRPCFMTHNDWFAVNGERHRPGLYWHSWNKAYGDNEPEPVDTWVSSPIHAIALTQDEHGSNHGLLLRFCDPSGKWKEWAAPLHLLKGSGEELRGELLSNGLRYNLQAQRLLLQWMMSQYPKRWIIAATTTGWSPQADAFVLPGGTIGNTEIRFQSEHAAHDAYMQRGTLEGWRENVSKRCEGNLLLVLAVSVAVTGPLILKARQQHTGGAGLHCKGDSSKGKTTLLQVAASVWGGPDFVSSWRGTGNGQEATFAARNDTFHALDEISESNSKEIGSIVYALANGHGKQRAARTGGARLSARWRIMALSSGERSLSAHMSESGQRVKAGQEARLLDIPGTNRRHGAFDELHGFGNGSQFSNALKESTSKDYGLAGPEFVARLVDDEDDLPGLYAKTCNLPGFTGSDGVESRAGGIFALIAMAGEKATEYQITGWAEGEALNAAMWAFNEWRSFRGQGSTEHRQILNGIRDFIARHGDSRFSERRPSTDSAPPVRDRAGYWEESDDGRIYYFNGPGLQEAGNGHDMPRILEAVESAGWIVERDGRKRSKRKKVSGQVVALYALRPEDPES
ncbi:MULTISPECIES: DUF927 domain-containing protein [Marinobacter]|uniref:DUF927 domain-containing protein n=1 Tax=Marinobacter TaxID=2742 RepID=UPI0029432C45|nr:DUF927 domain-containing protein [Marinobacter salarius]WOI18111.1 DUF927 domain-containing protein [Marinobacter salarius]